MQPNTHNSSVISRTKTAVSDYWELTKPEVNVLVVVSTFAGFYLGSAGAANLRILVCTLLGTALVSAGTAAFNQLLESKIDGKMRRTCRRPIPAGRVRPTAAFWFAAVLSVAGLTCLAMLVNMFAALLALGALVSYLLLYTPLKTRTPLCTTVGAIPGAVPPLIGWAAARHELSLGAWVLYAILFLWQFPHFLSIAWMYREDYARGGIRVLPVVDVSGKKTGRHIVFYSLALLPVSLVPTLLGLASPAYLGTALLLGLAFFCCAARAAMRPSNSVAKQLLHGSVAYLTVLMIVLVGTRV